VKQIQLRDVARTGLPASLLKGEKLFDPTTGIVRSIIPNSIEQGDPTIHAYGALTCHTERLNFNRMSVRMGGASLSREGAIAATIGEGVERYCAAYYEPDELVFAAYNDVAADAVHPAKFGLFSERQYQQPDFQYTPFTPETRITWTWGYSLQHKRPTLVPAALTYLPFRVDAKRGEVVISNTTSTGLACGGTLEEAILSGIGEAVERDGVTSMWLTRMRVPHVEVDRNSGLYETFQKNFALPGLRYYICDATSDLGLPVFFVLLVGDSNQGRMINAGCCANLSPERAALKSFVEAAQGRPYLRFAFQQEPEWECAEDFSNIRDFDDHARVYSKMPHHFGALDFITSPRTTVNLSDMPDLSTGSVSGDIEVYLARLRQQDIDVIVVDLTTPDVEEAGFKVVRVITPGLQLLHGDHLRPFLGCPRLYRLPVTLGYRDRLIKEEELNPYPHPLP
jgi:ribosomal protein S12 methylthiotransferase accessory factor